MLEINNLKISVNNQVIINDFTYQFKNGVYKLEGANGTGKSSFYHAIFNLTNYSGEILISGEYVKRFKNVAYVSQFDYLVESLSVGDNLKMFACEKKVEKYLGLFNINYLLKRKIKKLSGGERKKVQLVIALSYECPVLLLDEAHNNLDQESVDILNQIIHNYSGIVIYTSHLDLKIPQETVLKISDNNVFTENQSPVLNNQYSKEKCNADKQSEQVSTSKYLILKLVRLNIIWVSIIFLIFVLGIVGLICKRTKLYEDSFVNGNNQFKSDTSLIIEPPIMNELNYAYGTSKWYETTPFYLPSEMYDQLQASNLVEEVIPLSADGKFTSFYYDNKQEYQLAATDNGISEINFLNYPAQVINNTELFNVNLNKIEGSIPKDDANEILIPQAIAAEYHYQVGDDIELKFSNYQNDADTISVNYKVSGIYTSINDQVSSNCAYLSFQTARYDDLNENVIKANSETMEQEISFVKANTSTSNLNEKVDQNSDYYYGFYIDTVDTKATDKVLDSLYEYDPYLNIKGNEVAKYNKLKLYQDTYMQSNLKFICVMYLVALGIFIVCYDLNSKYLRQNVYPKLSFYNVLDFNIQGVYVSIMIKILLLVIAIFFYIGILDYLFNISNLTTLNLFFVLVLIVMNTILMIYNLRKDKRDYLQKEGEKPKIKSAD